MIKNLIFDMGNVLVEFSQKKLVSRFHLSEADEQLLCTETFSLEWVQLDRGSIDYETAIRRICRRLPERLHDCVVQLVHGWWKKDRTPMPGMAELLRDLKQAGYGVYVLTNAALSSREYFHLLPCAPWCDGCYVSAEHRLLKPEHEIYEDFLRTYGLTAESCFFVDDNAANIDGALQVGIDGAVFHGDAERLRRELHEKGVL